MRNPALSTDLDLLQEPGEAQNKRLLRPKGTETTPGKPQTRVISKFHTWITPIPSPTTPRRTLPPHCVQFPGRARPSGAWGPGSPLPLPGGGCWWPRCPHPRVAVRGEGAASNDRAPPHALGVRASPQGREGSGGRRPLRSGPRVTAASAHLQHAMSPCYADLLK